MPRYRYIPQNFSSLTIPYDYSIDSKKYGNRDAIYRIKAANELEPEDILVIGITDLEDLRPEDFNSLHDLMGEVRRRQDETFSLFMNVNGGNNIYSVMGEIHPGTNLYAFWKKFGDEFILQVFKSAREISDNRGLQARLIYNETYNYARDYTFYGDTLRIVQLLKQHGLIDGVGMQMHMFLNGNEVEPNLTEMVEVMRSFGVPVYITEFDISQKHLTGNRDLEQARIAALVVQACIKSGVCVDLGFFGTEDSYSWLGADAKAHLFDEKGNKKLFYYAVLHALYETK
jgi:hypothetical protein